MMKANELTEEKLYRAIQQILANARQKVLNQVNQTMVYTYYEVDRIIVENEQGGKNVQPMEKVY